MEAEAYIGFITGDIIKSRSAKHSNDWLESLKQILCEYGTCPQTLDIYMGDSFQLKIKEVEDALSVALLLKSGIKSIPKIDVRMAVGIGKGHYNMPPHITEDNSEAAVNSGLRFDKLKAEKITLAVNTPWKELNRQFDILIYFAGLVINGWTTATATAIYHHLRHPDQTQHAITQAIGITQPAISQAQKRGHLAAIIKLNTHYKSVIKQKLYPYVKHH